MAVHFIVSVGTSIIKNVQDKDKNKNVSINVNPSAPIDIISVNSIPRSPANYLSNFSQLHNKFKIFPGAEQKSILKAQEKNIGGDQFIYHLICTRTPKCIFCASYLGHEVLKGQTVNYYFPEKLGEADNPDFVKSGIPNLLDVLAEILGKIEKNPSDNAIIIPTGGYKAIIPYLTIASILYKCPACYIYETSDELLDLPAPPLGVNTNEFRVNLTLLQNLQDMDVSNAQPYFQALPESFQKLVYINNGNKYMLNAFGLRLKEMYTGQTVSPLVVRTTHHSLIRYLDNYTETFKRMTELGETIWIGDKAPEMADHARYHHLNLLGYAELLLLPVFAQNNNFLSPHELFLLLGTIYLHDCGHSLCNLENTPLLRSEIRNYHNLLGYKRLQSDEFKSLLKRQGLPLDNSILKNIATLSVFHRKKMPLLRGQYKNQSGGFSLDSLNQITLLQGGQQINGPRLAMLAALFRIIDGMDKQVARAGDAMEISMKAEAILADLEHMHDRSCRLGKMLETIDITAKRIVDKRFVMIATEYTAKETVSGQTSSARLCNGWGCGLCAKKSPSTNNGEKPAYEELENELGADLKKYLPLAWEYLDARVNLIFMALQPTYYYSDLLLDMPRVSHRIESGTRHITIAYKQNENEENRDRLVAIWKEISNWIKTNCRASGEEPEREIAQNTFPKAENIVSGIREEYCGKNNSEVAQVLSDNKIIIEFMLDGKSVPCWQ